MYRTGLLWLALCFPVAALHSLSAFLAAAALGPAVLVAAYFLLRAQPAPQSLAEQFRNLVVAHRGGQRAPPELGGTGDSIGGSGGEHEPVFPENSLAAFRWASSPACGGADAVELDVWLSSDGVCMVNHDADVFRHFDGRGLVSSMTRAQLQALKYLRRPLLPAKLGSTNYSYEQEQMALGHAEIHPSYIKSERMPTLEEVLDLLASEAPHMKVMIEVKERANIAGVCRALAALYARHAWMYERCWVAAFNPFLLWKLRREDKRIVTSFLFVDHLTRNLLKNAADMRIPVPLWFSWLRPARWAIDDAIWALGTNPPLLRALGASMSACEVKALTEGQIRREKAAGIITSTWCANNHHQKEWLLECGVTVITDLQFSGGTASASPRPQAI